MSLSIQINPDDSVIVKESGSTNVEIEALSVNQNGVYEESGVAFSPVSVNVPQGWTRALLPYQVHTIEDAEDPSNNYDVGIIPHISFGPVGSDQFIAGYVAAPESNTVYAVSINTVSSASVAVSDAFMFQGGLVDITTLTIDNEDFWVLFNGELGAIVPDATYVAIYLYERQV